MLSIFLAGGHQGKQYLQKLLHLQVTLLKQHLQKLPLEFLR